jgi:hypothetical protein
MENPKRTSKGQFKTGQSGNPSGRPPGSRNKTTLACEQLLDGKALQLTAKLAEMALEGNIQAIRMYLDRTVPPRRERCVHFELRPITGPEDLALQFQDLTAAVTQGEITPSDGEALSNILMNQAKTLQLVEIARRLPEIKRQQFRFEGTLQELLLSHYRSITSQSEETENEANHEEPKESPDA